LSPGNSFIGASSRLSLDTPASDKLILL